MILASERYTGGEIRQTTIGGQALIEGLMMMGPEKCALSVRLQNGLIYREEKPAPNFGRAGRVPFVRGSVRLFRQLFIGMKALTRSADLAELEGPEADRLPLENLYRTATEQAESAEVDAVAQGGMGQANTEAKADLPAGSSQQVGETAPVVALNREEGQAGVTAASGKSKSQDWLYGLAMAVGAVAGIALFMFLPNLIVTGIKLLAGGEADGFTASLAYNLLEGLVRIAVLLGYMWLTSLSKDIARTWQYHGAEHKTIACYEHGLPLTIANVRACSRFHPRCGTSFLFLVVIISSLLFSLFGWHAAWLNILIRLALIPVVVGISFELQRYSGSRVDRPLGRLITRPGLWLQRLTTREPDDAIIETAINAMLAVLPATAGADDWN